MPENIMGATKKYLFPLTLLISVVLLMKFSLSLKTLENYTLNPKILQKAKAVSPLSLIALLIGDFMTIIDPFLNYPAMALS